MSRDLPIDLSPFIRQRLTEGIARARARFASALEDPGFTEFCIRRFSDGDREYGYRREWVAWPENRFLAEGSEEIADFVLYETMAIVASEIAGVRDA